MSWNEPGGDKKDPWSGGGDSKGPPDLDEAIRLLQEKIKKFFGNEPSNNDGNDGDGGDNHSNSLKSVGFFLGGAAILWGLSGFYIVDEGNNGVETRFGQYIGTTQAGLNWHLPAPIEQVNIVNVKQQRFIEVGYRSVGSGQLTGSVPKESLMLTKDENYVDVRLAVQYQVKDAKEFIFSLANPVTTLEQVTQSAQRGVVGSSTMDYVLTEGRSEIVTLIKKEIQDVMDSYHSGVQITSVNLQDAQPPEQVQNAFEDAIKAREDQQRLINEAQAYSNDVVPRARGAAARKLEEADGYKEQVIAQAEGETARFSKLLTEYSKAPEVTRKRIYIETMESVLAQSNTVLVDVKNGNNMMYLPLDKLVPVPQNNAPANSNPPVPTAASDVVTPTPAASNAPHENVTERLSTMRGRDERGR
jgi:membrane protease subunit HflK